MLFTQRCTASALVFCLFALSAVAQVTNLAPHTWTDLQGRQIVATLVSISSDGREVTLRKDGATQTSVVSVDRLSKPDHEYIAQQRPKPVPAGGPSDEPATCMSVGPWEIRVVSFESVRTYKWNSGASSGTFEAKPPSDRIALVRIKGKATRALTSSEKARIKGNLSKGSDLGKLAMMLYDAYKSKAFISNHFFALTSLTNPQAISLSMCHWIESKQGLADSTTYDKAGIPNSYLGYVSGDFEALLIFAHRSTVKSSLLLFLPYGDETSMVAARIETDKQDKISVRYGTVEELRTQAQ